MNLNWEQHAIAAVTDIAAARAVIDDNQEALEHLQDAAKNLERAIDALDEDLGNEHLEEETT